jgi:hypothetical protein
VPDRGIVRLGLEAFDVIVIFPLTLPAATGVNATVKVALWPAASVTGVVIPLRLYPVPLTPTWEIVTLVPPVFVTVSDRDCLLPTVMLPKPRLVGFEPSPPGATPVPDKGMLRVGLEAFEVIVTLPLTLVVEAGVNVIVKVALWPGVNIAGVVIPVTLYPVPLIPT